MTAWKNVGCLLYNLPRLLYNITYVLQKFSTTLPTHVLCIFLPVRRCSKHQMAHWDPESRQLSMHGPGCWRFSPWLRQPFSIHLFQPVSFVVVISSPVFVRSVVQIPNRIGKIFVHRLDYKYATQVWRVLGLIDKSWNHLILLFVLHLGCDMSQLYLTVVVAVIAFELLHRVRSEFMMSMKMSGKSVYFLLIVSKARTAHSCFHIDESLAFILKFCIVL